MKKLIIIISLFISSCNTKDNTNPPIVKVFDDILYKNEISSHIPNNSSKDDSILMAETYIRNWISKKLLLNKALKNLAPNSEIEKKVEDYRTSLLIYNYKQKQIQEHKKFEITDEEIENYYKLHSNNFTLATPLVKASIVILQKNAPNLDDVREWIHSDKPEDHDKLLEYCYSKAIKYDNFNNKWIEAKSLVNLIPGDIRVIENEIKNLKYIEKEDGNNLYFVVIHNIKMEQTTPPIEYVKNEIKMILKNKKQLNFENELEKRINIEGRKKKYVKMY